MSNRIFKDRQTHLPEFCRPTGDILSRMGDKWSLSVLGRLYIRRWRFTELQNDIDGISQRMLTLTLRGLERDGLAKRIVHPAVPPKVEYELTERGTSLIPTLRALGNWATANHSDIERSRQAFDAAADVDN
ncbi:MAG: HxlR family transcriptional regulator [Hyphomicrobiales bacterium]|nr:HxlR family transcriptional regulator [Hyphomicrobiales bacterium]